MPENDDDSRGTIVPFPIARTMTAAIAGRLVEYYSGLLAEPLPPKHVALLQRFDALTQERSAAPTLPKIRPEKAKSAD